MIIKYINKKIYKLARKKFLFDMDLRNCSKDISILDITLFFIKKYKKSILTWQIFGLCETVNSIGTPIVISFLISGIEGKSSADLQIIVFKSVFMFIGFMFLLEIMHKTAIYIKVNKVQPYVRSELKGFLFNNIVNKKIDFFSTKDSGEVVTKVHGVVEEYTDLFQHTISFFIPNIVSGLLFIVSFLFVDYRLALCLIVGTAVQIYNLNILGKYSKRQSMKTFKLTSILNDSFVDVIRNIKNIKSSNKENFEFERFNKYNSRDMRRYKKAILAIFGVEFSMGIIFLSTIIVFFGLVLFLLKQNAISVSAVSYSFLAVSNYLSILYYISMDFNVLITRYGVCQESLSMVNENNPVKIQECQYVQKSDFKTITFKNVAFTFKNRKEGVLNGVNLCLEKGKKYGIIGPSGSGKSTVLNILTKQIIPTDGAVYFDDVNVNSMSNDEFFNNFCVISQNASLFNRSIKDNICYLNTTATEEDMIKAAKLAGAHEFIEKLPHGYYTVISDSIGLSGGQKQRVVLARAILSKAEILILDESTAFLDARTEEFINESIRKIFKDRTVIVVAHKVKNIVNVDKTFVFEAGKISAQGSHEELLKNSSFYKDFVGVV